MLTQAPRAVERLLQFTGSLECFWRLHGNISDGRHYLAVALSLSGAQEPDRARAFALIGAANLARMQHEVKKATAWYEESLAISRRLKHKEGIAAALDNLAQTAREQGDYRKARSLLEQANALNYQFDFQKAVAPKWNQAGSMSGIQRDYDDAKQWSGETVASQRESSHDRVIASARTSIGLAALERGEFEVAGNCLSHSLRMWNRLGDREGTITPLLGLAKLACLENKAEWGAALFRSAREFRELRHRLTSSSEPSDWKKMEAWLHARFEGVNYQRILSASEPVPIDHILARLQAMVNYSK